MKYTRLIKLLPFLLVFLAAMYKPYDADLGWHLKYGQYFFQHFQVLKTNIYSTEMAGYYWANTDWVTDLLTYVGYSLGGFLGLTILSSIVVTLTFFFFSKATKLTFWQQSFIFPLVLYLEQPINQVSFRGQQISLLLIGVLFYILSLFDEKNPKRIFWIIPLFWIWINLNGEFLLGLALFIVWAGVYVFREIFIKSKPFKDIFYYIKYFGGALVGAISLSLANPFGIKIYEVAISHANSPLLSAIIEYLPFDKFSDLWWNHVLIAAFFVVAVIYFWLDKTLLGRLPFIGMFLVIFVMAIKVRRFAWPTYYMSIFLLQPLALLFEPKNKKLYNGMATLLLIISIFWTIKLKHPIAQFQTMNWTEYCQSYVECSPAALEFILRSGPPANLLTFYNWGGWMIWNYPQIKPSIDGRMHLWNDNGYSGFQVYYNLEQNFSDINNSKYDAVLISHDKPLYNRLKQLASNGTWKLAYEDRYAAYFTRN